MFIHYICTLHDKCIALCTHTHITHGDVAHGRHIEYRTSYHIGYPLTSVKRMQHARTHTNIETIDNWLMLVMVDKELNMRAMSDIPAIVIGAAAPADVFVGVVFNDFGIIFHYSCAIYPVESARILKSTHSCFHCLHSFHAHRSPTLSQSIFFSSSYLYTFASILNCNLSK